MMNKIILQFCFFVFGFGTLSAQLETALFYTPTTLVNGNHTMNFELKHHQTARSRFLLSTSFRRGFVNRRGRFSVASPNYLEPFSFNSGDQITRFGISLDHRISLLYDDEKEKKKTTYFSYGLDYSSSNIEFNVIKFDASDSLNISQGTEVGYVYKINSLSLVLQLGRRFELGERVILDVFSGLKLKQSFSKSDSPIRLRDYRSGFLSPDYTGIAPLIGFRMGVFLNKFAEE